MSATDPELYLRVLSERALLDPDSEHRGGRTSAVRVAAEALVAAGALEPTVALRAVNDDLLAHELRGRHYPMSHHRARPRRAPVRFPERHAARLDHTVQVEHGQVTLHDIYIAASRSTIHYTWLAEARTRGGRGGSIRLMGGGGSVRWAKQAPVITDAAGHSPTVAESSGGGNDTRWDGTLTLEGHLDADTPWIEFDGEQIPLDRRTALISVALEPLDPQSPIERHLSRLLAQSERPWGGPADVGPALDALTAVGLLAAADPLARQVRAIADALPTHPHHQQHARGSSRGLPEPWRSLLARQGRGRGRGKVRALLVGATTPVFDEMQVSVDSVLSGEGGFDVECAVTPGAFGRWSFGGADVSWWARDDRGNHYLGGPTNWSGGEDRAEGTLHHWPALDPKATRLELLPTGTDHRAVIAISLEDPGAEDPR